MPRWNDEKDVELFVMEIPPRVTRRLRKETQALMEMGVDKKTMAFFPLPENFSYEKWATRVGSWMNTARRHGGGSYIKRRVEFEDEVGIGVWRVK